MTTTDTRATLEEIKKQLIEIYDRVDDLVLAEHDRRAVHAAVTAHKEGRTTRLAGRRRRRRNA